VSFAAELALVALHRHIHSRDWMSVFVLVFLDLEWLLAVVALHVAYIF
jgi:hypothetical protein